MCGCVWRRIRAAQCIHVKGSPRTLNMCSAAQRQRFDVHDPCRRFIGDCDGHAEAPQRLHRRAKTHVENLQGSTAGTLPTRTIPAEGSSARRTRTEPQRQRRNTHDPRRRFIRDVERQHDPSEGFIIGDVENLHRHSASAATRRIPVEGS